MLKTRVNNERDNVEELIVLLGLLVVDSRVDGEYELVGVLEDLLNYDIVDETTVEAIMRKLLQLIVAFSINDELGGVHIGARLKL